MLNKLKTFLKQTYENNTELMPPCLMILILLVLTIVNLAAHPPSTAVEPKKLESCQCDVD